MIDGFACVVNFGADDEVASFDVVPAFKRNAAAAGKSPTPNVGNLDLHQPQDATTSRARRRTKSATSKFVPFVKMIKGINRDADEPIQPSFLLEVMAQELVTAAVRPLPRRDHLVSGQRRRAGDHERLGGLLPRS